MVLLLIVQLMVFEHALHTRHGERTRNVKQGHWAVVPETPRVHVAPQVPCITGDVRPRASCSNWGSGSLSTLQGLECIKCFPFHSIYEKM